MSTPWKWAGARWWKFDFHAHTPVSKDTPWHPLIGKQGELTPEQWLLKFMEAGINCVAITDHNSGEWIDQLKEAYARMETEHPEGFREIHLLPGVEISVSSGLHVLAVFDKDKTSQTITHLLGAVGFPEHLYGETNVQNEAACTRESLVKVVEEIHRLGGIAIPAHVDQNKGLLQIHGDGRNARYADEIKSVLKSNLLAIEVKDKSASQPVLYTQSGVHWTEVAGSDCHNFREDSKPGSRFTWVKMGVPTLEGLRLALLDGPLSIKRSDEKPDDPNRHAELVIESISISQARYVGRSQSFIIELNPWLNSLIGGRGTGKSTLLEFLRLTLRRNDELPGALKDDFAKYFRAYASRDEDGLLTDNAHFTVAYRKNGVRYRIQWNQQADVQPIESEDDGGGWKVEKGDIVQRFPVRIYSQKQIFEMAKTPLALLKIVDDAPEVDRLSWSEEWKAEETRFLSLRAKAREIETGLMDEARIQGELKDVQNKLAVFEQAGDALIRKEYQKRLRQQRVLEEWEKSWADAGNRIREMAEDIEPDPLDTDYFTQQDEADKTLLNLSAGVLEALRKVSNELHQMAQGLDDTHKAWVTDRDKSQWNKAVQNAINAYEQLRKELSEKGVDDPSAYGELVQRRQTLEGRLKDFDSRRKQVESLRGETQASLDKLLEIRHGLTKRRQAFLEKTLQNNPYVRIEVIPYGASEIVEEEFRRIIQRDKRDSGGFDKDIGSPDGKGLLGALYRGKLAPKEFENRLETLKQKILDIVSGKSSSEVRDQRFVSHLANLPPESLDRLDLWFPEDSLKVEYSATADGKGFRSIQEGSPGQKTAALLAFLLSYGAEPIVLDQPEDDLDNHLIYELIVTQIREIKQRRQVIVVTHNANIVVNGDAELVVGLVARGRETKTECMGCLQEKRVREVICAVMEGGREAFERRYRRIALEG